MTPPGELATRLDLVRRVLDLTSEPLHRPLGVYFSPLDGDAYLEAWRRHGREVGPEGSGATYGGSTLYVHIPFCARVCSYCLLSSTRTPGKGPVDDYVTALRRQIALMAPLCEGLTFHSLHIGGGTPSLLSEAQLDALLGDLTGFRRAEGFQIGVEAHPSTASASKLALLARHGVDRVSFGVESFTPEVLRLAVRDDQTAARVATAVRAAREAGLAVNIDMLAGLPGETEASFADSVRQALALGPDSMSVNRFLAENSPLARLGYGPDADEHRTVDRMLLEADRLVRELSPPRWPEAPLALPGYGTQYVWDHTGKARAYFQDDMIGPASTLALGHGALGHIHGQMFSVPAGTHLDFVSALAAGRPPAMLASPASVRFEMAFYLADRACRGDLSLARFAAIFGHSALAVFGRELGFLASAGLVRVQGDRVSKPARLDFQVTHLLAFLARTTAGLTADLRALSPRGTPATGVSAPDPGRVAPLPLARWTDPDSRPEVTVAGDGGQAQYRAIRAELPPSLLWCRLAMRASQASQGGQRLAVAAPREERTRVL